ncbi:hypothetical protein GLYMA_09G065400v4 [Glycine max]|uniref:Uncharacterized protein n=1 Tax=Glycine max TaxID=3847 RepID=K7LC67_SOYBN|nr:hypothetical protein GYH30_024239 [Glycine max]KRH37424.1 hypothetical protein GLYMA_09G065400v4 [Glycine max]
MDSVMSPAFSLEPNETLFRAFLGESLFIGAYFLFQKPCLSGVRLDGIKVWHKGQDYVDHLATKVDSIPCVDRSFWNKIDAQLCGVLKTTKFGNRPQVLYTNDTQRLNGVRQFLMNIIAPHHLDGPMTEYLGKVHSLIHMTSKSICPLQPP